MGWPYSIPDRNQLSRMLPPNSEKWASTPKMCGMFSSAISISITLAPLGVSRSLARRFMFILAARHTSSIQRKSSRLRHASLATTCKSCGAGLSPSLDQSIRVLQDAEVVRVGTLEVRAIETPGHASHHHVYQWERQSFLRGHCRRPDWQWPADPTVRSARAAHRIVARFDRKNPRAQSCETLLTAFRIGGGSVSSHLDALEERVRRWSTWFRDRIRAGENEQLLIPGVR